MTAPFVASDFKPTPELQRFELRCWAWATLWQCAELDLHDAVDRLQELATTTGLVATLGQDHVQKIIADEFARVS
jgi:hypothetical protein